MSKCLYIFITHKLNINNCYTRITEMMKQWKLNDDYIIVRGGASKIHYNSATRILDIDCNDKYEGLPEKVFKAYKFVINNSEFNHYSHFVKLDDDIKIVKILDQYILDQIEYAGKVNPHPGNRNWHIGRCSNDCKFNNMPYAGIYVPWCEGGVGYILSRNAINRLPDNINYRDHIYEDVMIAIFLKENNISPQNFNITQFVFSPDHTF